MNITSFIHLYKQRSSTKFVVAAFFVNRVVWNFLPEDIVDFSSLTAFKRTIKSVDFNAFLNVSEMQIKCTWTVKYIGTSVFIAGVQFYYSSVCLSIAFCFTVGLNVPVCNCLYYCITCFILFCGIS